jgi:DNA ligase-1
MSLLVELHERRISGHDALFQVSRVIHACQQYEALIYQVIDKQLYLRLGAKQILNLAKSLDHMVDTKSAPMVALAKTLSDNKTKVLFQSAETYYGSRKIDGIRAVIDPHGWLSRQGQPFPRAFPHLDTQLKQLLQSIGKSHDDVVIDGELVSFETGLMERSFGQVYSAVMKATTDYDVTNVSLVILDIIDRDDFWQGSSNETLMTRYQLLTHVFTDEMNGLRRSDQYPNLFILSQQPVTTQQALDSMVEMSHQNEWEGLILRRDTGYKGGRSNDLYKVKQFQDAEYIVEGCEMTDMPIKNTESGGWEQHKVLGQIYISHRGHRVAVGSGLSLTDRLKVAQNPELIMGKTVCVKYFRETVSADGSVSLRFPTIKTVYWGKGRDV